MKNRRRMRQRRVQRDITHYGRHLTEALKAIEEGPASQLTREANEAVELPRESLEKVRDRLRAIHRKATAKRPSLAFRTPTSRPGLTNPTAENPESEG